MFSSLRRRYGQMITSASQFIIAAFAVQVRELWVWFGSAVLIGLISLFAWRSVLVRRRLFTGTAIARIVSAAQGYALLHGRGFDMDESVPLLAACSNRPCLWYRYRVTESSGRHRSVVDSGESDTSFWIDDGTGRCLVELKGAEIISGNEKKWTEGNLTYVEWTLHAGETIYALGEFNTERAAARLSMRESMKNLLEEWKRNKKQLLERFDLNRDGEIDLQEWELARAAARREVEKTHDEIRRQPDVHCLRLPENGHLYLITNLNPKKIARHYLWWLLFHIAVFFTALALLPWLWTLAV